MSHLRILSRLYWKEARQMLPLAVVLLVIGFFTHVLFLLQRQSSGHYMAFISLPMLFAIGVGALLIGQERETKTLSWLQTLPIEPGDLLRSKLLTGIAGLIFVWMSSGMMFAVFGWLCDISKDYRPVELTLPPMAILILATHSLFMLLAGVYLSWRFRSSLFALFLLVPICVFPFVVMRILLGGSLWEHKVPWIAGMLTCGIVIAFKAGWQAAIVCLNGEKTRINDGSKPQDANVEVDAATKTIWLTPHRPTNGLLWQFLNHNRTVLVTSTLLMLAATVCLPFNEWRGVASLIATLGASWSSASVFAGDAQRGSVHFLAARGISAARTWLTRQAIPLTLLSAFALLGLQILDAFVSPIAWELQMLAIVGVWLTYVSCQWFGQVVNSPIVAAILAPACAGLAFGAAEFAVTTIGTPIWVVVLISFVPLLTTFFLTRCWMDGRTGFTYWSIHIACLALCGVLPFATLLPIYFSPSMPAATLQELNQPTAKATLSESLALPEEVKSLLHSSLPIAPTGLEELRRNATTLSPLLPKRFNKLKAQAINARRAEKTEEAAAIYRKCVAEIARLAANLRQSTLISYQDAADAIEMWLLREMRRPGSQLAIGDTSYNAVAHLLAANDFRTARRKIAVVESWREWQKQKSSLQFGGYSLRKKLPISGWHDAVAAKRRIERAFGHLWTLAQGDGASNQDTLESLAKELGYPAAVYDQSRNAAASEPIFHSVPGRMFGGAWEQLAKDLPPVITDRSEADDDNT